MRWILVVGPVVAFAVFAATIFVWLNSYGLSDRERRHFEQNRSALCTLRHDLNERAKAGRRFLREHPMGIAGISRAVILNGIRGQESTVNALSSLNCGN